MSFFLFPKKTAKNFSICFDHFCFCIFPKISFIVDAHLHRIFAIYSRQQNISLVSTFVVPVKNCRFRNYLWTASCLILAIFPQLETVGKTPIPFLVILAPFLAVTLVAFINRIKPSNNLVFNNLPFILASAGTVILISNFCHSAPFLVKLASWSSLPSAFLLPLLASQNLAERLVCWLAALFLPYSLLTLAYESIFVLVFSVLLFTYVRLEYSHISDDQFFQLEVKSAVSNLDLGKNGHDFCWTNKPLKFQMFTGHLHQKNGNEHLF